MLLLYIILHYNAQYYTCFFFCISYDVIIIYYITIIYTKHTRIIRYII